MCRLGQQGLTQDSAVEGAPSSRPQSRASSADLSFADTSEHTVASDSPYCDVSVMSKWSITVDLAKVQVSLMDNTSGADTIPSMRIAVSDVFVSHAAETRAVVPQCASSGLVGMTADTKFSMDVQAAVASQYFNSRLDVEEALISVRCCLFATRFAASSLLAVLLAVLC